MDAANGVGLAANQIGVSKRVFVYDCADVAGPHRPSPRGRRQPGAGDLRGSRDDARPRRRRRGLPVGARRVSSPPAGPTGRGSPDSTPTARRSRSRAPDLFARMLQHETGHLDGFLYLDRLVGRHARAAKRAVKSQRLGCAGPELDARRGPRPVRPLSRRARTPARRHPGQPALPAAARFVAAADRRGRPPAWRSVRRCGCAPNAVTMVERRRRRRGGGQGARRRTGAHRATSAISNTPPPRLAGRRAAGVGRRLAAARRPAATPAAPIRRCRLRCRRRSARTARRSSTGTPAAA